MPGTTKKTGLEDMYMKMTKSLQIDAPLRLDFDVRSCTELLFSLFRICPISAKLGGQKPLELSPMGVYGSTKMKRERFRKHKQHVTTKVSTHVTNMSQTEGPPIALFCVFLGPHPKMVSKASPDRLQGPKACQNGGLEKDSLLFCLKYLILFGGVLEMIRAKFIVVFV